MSKVLMKGNEAIALAAIAAGLDAFFGYPITPQNEIPEYLSKYMHEKGRVFVQAESEVAAINMVYGAAAAGKREHRSRRLHSGQLRRALFGEYTVPRQEIQTVPMATHSPRHES